MVKKQKKYEAPQKFRWKNKKVIVLLKLISMRICSNFVCWTDYASTK